MDRSRSLEILLLPAAPEFFLYLLWFLVALL